MPRNCASPSALPRASIKDGCGGRKGGMENVEFAESSASWGESDLMDGEAEAYESDDFDARPIGSPLRISGKGEDTITYYSSLESEGTVYELEDSVLLTPVDYGGRPLAAILKEISQDTSGDVTIRYNRFYRHEEVKEEEDADCLPLGSRELFYSFDIDEADVRNIMHKCIVHFLAPQSTIPDCTKYPGFIVRKIYDSRKQKFWKITDGCLLDENKQEISQLIKKTEECFRQPPFTNDNSKIKIDDVIRNTSEIGLHGQRKDHLQILEEFGVCTGESYRDKWLERLLSGIQVSYQSETIQIKDKESIKDAKAQIISKECENIIWPDDAVVVVAALEKAVHKAFGVNFSKYKQKMRHYNYNIRHSSQLAKRLLKKELEPSLLLKMSPVEMKEGMLATEKESHTSELSRPIKEGEVASEKEGPQHEYSGQFKEGVLATVDESHEPLSSGQMKRVNDRCFGCSQRHTAVMNIINAGKTDEQNRVECKACGQTWPFSARKKPLEGT